MKPLTHLEVAERYVAWAADRGISPESVVNTLTRYWPHMKLSYRERQYIGILAHRLCPAGGWVGILQQQQKNTTAI
jgi:hypothetical protein